jgi:hypothetical protein
MGDKYNVGPKVMYKPLRGSGGNREPLFFSFLNINELPYSRAITKIAVINLRLERSPCWTSVCGSSTRMIREGPKPGTQAPDPEDKNARRRLFPPYTFEPAPRVRAHFLKGSCQRWASARFSDALYTWNLSVCNKDLDFIEDAGGS